MAQRRTDVEIRKTHRDFIAAGCTLCLAGAAVDFLPPVAELVPFGAAAQVGYSAALLLGGGALAHRYWYFHPDRQFLRQLGGPDGWLDRHDLAETAGEEGVRKLAPLPAWSAGQAPRTTDFGWQAGRLVSGARGVRGRAVYSPWSRGVGIVGPQGSGKTQFLVNLLLDSPGPVVAPSTKPELVVLTRALRELVGPTAVFNPGLLGSIGSDFAWDPVSGCTDQAVADRRAWAHVRGGGGAAGINRPDFWARKAQEILRCYFFAAASAGLGMDRVMRWANDPDDAEPVKLMERAGALAPPGWLPTLITHLKAAPNTRTGYFATVTSCVGYMDSPTVAAACRPRPGKQFNVADFLRSRGTLYMVGAAGDERLSPLLTALTEYMFDEAQRIAAAQPGGRLSPTLNFVLDEVANTTPVPLHRWTSDSRGWGITVVAVVQARAQFKTTWGADQADVIWENLPTKIILPGVSNVETLQNLSFLGGSRWTLRTTRGESSSDGRTSLSSSQTPTREPVVDGHTISAMPLWHAYVLGLARHPAIVRYEPGYKRVEREQKALAAAWKSGAPHASDPQTAQVVQLPPRGPR